MKPDNQALQVFYGTAPLIIVLLAIFWRENALLKDILARLGRMEGALDKVKDSLAQVRERLVKLESRAGIVFHD